jgi:hypothetical protein
VQDHGMVKVFIHPGDDFGLKEFKVHDHAELIENIGLDHKYGPSIMSVQVGTLAGITRQTVSETKFDLFLDAKHGSSPHQSGA